MPFTLTNDADGTETLSVGTDTTMTLTVTNRTGGVLELASGTTVLTLRLPEQFFTAAQMTAMQPTAEGWTGVAAADHTVTFTCSRSREWDQASAFTFKIAHMRSDGTPRTQAINLRPKKLTPKVPGQGTVPIMVPWTLTLKEPPGTKLPLPLAASLSGGGVVYRSTASDPLVNTLVLTLKNTSSGPIGALKKPAGAPQVQISFVYGTSAGALAPSSWPPNDPPPADSAWRIHAEPEVAETLWQVTNADSNNPPPVWTLTPTEDNGEILGPASSDTANFSVKFSRIRSFTEVGHTQMVLLCTGFKKDEQTAYQDLVIVLDLDKADPPVSRGLLAFDSPEPVVVAATPNVPLKLTFRWTMYAGVAKVRMVTSSRAVPEWERSYPDPQPLAFDKTEITMPAPPNDEALFVTLQAFAGGNPPEHLTLAVTGPLGTFLNQAQYTVAIHTMYVTDDVGNVYPVQRFGNTLWMLADYNLPTTSGSSVYPGNPAPGPAGRLYEWSTARARAPQGWTLPTEADWDALKNDPRWVTAPYPALVFGGTSGFSAVLGGWYIGRRYDRRTTAGYYWMAEPRYAMQFISRPGEDPPGVVVKLATDNPQDTQVSARYVRHL
jgi:hypothetical protein